MNTRDAEEILYSHTYMLWVSCTDPLRRARFLVVLNKHRTRMEKMGFTLADLERIETFAEDRLAEHS